MQIIENRNVKEKLYIEKLKNGLTVMVLPKKDMQKKFVIWSTNYGSIDNKFIIPGEDQITEVPDGVAHFLEHKLFEQENGTNSLDTLTAIGVNANAYTTNDHTAYLFEGIENFYPALDALMDYVQHPYFTDENVEKEKGIIGQEIMMYDDYPEWVVYMNAVKAMYKVNPINIDITGTVETISKIDKNILYKCYNTFYNPSNMIMFICGEFEPEEIIKYVEEHLISDENIGEIKRIYENEPDEIVKPIIKAKMEVSMPMFIIGIKDKIDFGNEDIVKKHMAIEILLNILLGKSSKLYKELYEQMLIKEEFGADYEFSKTYAHVVITGESDSPEEVLKRINEKIEELKKTGINEEEFISSRNMIYGTYVKEYNSISDISKMFISDYFRGINSFDYIENCFTITKEYVEQILKDVFDPNKTVLSIVS
ncbi:MAG: insulinase family protein [Lachnospiraceae bacterium]|jgi:predicted Zn-dependent peptidase|nr:insulinase family protein [Lachnospiraceae bacterium]